MRSASLLLAGDPLGQDALAGEELVAVGQLLLLEPLRRLRQVLAVAAGGLLHRAPLGALHGRERVASIVAVAGRSPKRQGSVRIAPSWRARERRRRRPSWASRCRPSGSPTRRPGWGGPTTRPTGPASSTRSAGFTARSCGRSRPAKRCASWSAPGPRRRSPGSAWLGPAPRSARVDFLSAIRPTGVGRATAGPIFVRRRSGRRAETAIVHFHFNAWAKYPDFRKDRRVPETAARRFAKRLFSARVGRRDFVLEGGGIDVNGRGTLLTTEECYLYPRKQVRNPGLEREDFEAAVRAWLGVTNVFWLGRGIAGDDTHGHVDDVCRFVNPRTLVLIKEARPHATSTTGRCAENWETDRRPAAGGRLEARGRGAADARAAVLRRRAPAGELRELLHRERGRHRARPSTTRTTASPWAFSASCSRTGRSSASTRSTWCWASARCTA